MIKMILSQSIYQVIITLVFHFLGHQILSFNHSKEGNLIMTTLVFNTFVFTQIFNPTNRRKPDNRLNTFEGIFENRYFIAITLIGVSFACFPKRFNTNDGL